MTYSSFSREGRSLSSFALFLTLLAGLSACASGTVGGDSGPTSDASIDTAPDVDVPDPNDRDEDGIPLAMDCDDNNPSIGRSAQRLCSGACGDGVEECMNGVWAPCSAPTDCDCNPADPPREVECGMCGTQRQICQGGTWTNDGSCSGAGECSPGEFDEQSEACGCGSRMRTRSCSARCSWGAWGAWGECSGGGSGCSPGETDSESRGCGSCGGSQMRSRTCSDTCDWGAWSEWGECGGGAGGACAPGDTRPCPGRESCSHQTCTSSCEWGTACELNAGAACDHVSDSGVAGGRFQCCGGGQWQFCLSSCQWSPACEACSGCGC